MQGSNSGAIGGWPTPTSANQIESRTAGQQFTMRS